MTFLQALIIDDEENARNTLRIFIENYFSSEVTIVGQAASCIDAIPLLNEFEPNLVFLDISMPEGSGFDLFSFFPNPDFETIFTTAYNQYALDAIKVSAVDYILKPIDIDELGKAIQKVYHKLRKQLVLPQTEVKTISLPTQEGFIFIQIRDIVYCEGDNNYTVFYMQNGEKHIVSKTLKEYDKILPATAFMRIHRSYLIQISHVRKYIKGAGGYVEMSNNVSLAVSRDKKEALLNILCG